MTKRSQSHQLENASILALQTRLPKAWVFRSEHPDYGIDGSIEVFAPDGSATGLRCWVQLKSTAKASKRPKVRIRIETSQYYRSLELPVLIVLYEADQDRLLVRWFHEFDPFYGGLGKKEIAFAFSEEHVWSGATAERIERDLRTLRVLRTGTLPLPVPVEISVIPERVGGISPARLDLAIRRELRKMRNTFREEGANAALQIRVDGERIVASLRGRHSISLHHSEAALEPELFAKDVLMLVSVVVARTGDHGLATTIAGRVAGRSKLMRIPEMAMHVAMSMVQSHQLALLLEVAEEMLNDEETRSAADSMMIAALVEGRENDALKSAVETHLRKRVAREEAEGDVVQLGTVHYNLGNWLRGQGRRREALRHYRLAAEVHPAYADRDYYYKELGGLLFGGGFYRASARFYGEAVRRGGPPLWKALQADALLFAGSFGAAREVFEQYAKEEEQPEPQWMLKAFVLDVISALELPESGRRTRVAKRVLHADEAQGEESGRTGLELDPLCAEAWLRLGAARAQQEDAWLASTAAIVGAVLAGGDPRLWAQAFMLSDHAGVPNISEMIAFAALHSVQDAFIAAVQEYAEAMDIPTDGLDQIAEAMGVLETEYERIRRRDTWEVRFGGHEATYEKFEIPLEISFDAGSGEKDEDGLR
jgi:tetratricopeptide (TPR) repeat protein